METNLRVKDIARAIEEFAPLRLQEDYDNAGLQVGDPDMEVTSVLICLDVTEDILQEAVRRDCNLIVSHHPLIFRGLKSLTGKDATQRIVAEAIRRNVAIYSAHTNLDSAFEGVSYEIAHCLGMQNVAPLEPNPADPSTGLGAVGDIKPTPCLEFLRKVKELFNVKELRYSRQSKGLVVRRIALCGGAGASMIRKAMDAGADVYVTGDLKYHDFTSYGAEILLADIGHYESELCTAKIFSRILNEKFPGFPICFSEMEKNPIKIL